MIEFLNSHEFPSTQPEPDDHVLADVAAVANLAAFADPRRPFDHRALLDHRALADEDRAADERLADQPSLDRGLQPKLQIARDLLERVPHIRRVLEEHPMLGVIQIEIVCRGEHHGAGSSSGSGGGVRGRSF